MLASGKMTKWLLLGVAVLLLPLALSCGSSSDSDTEEEDPVAAAMSAATKVVERQERAIGRAWAMAQVATAWYAVDPDAAQAAIDDAVEAAEETAAGGDEELSAAAKLRAQWDDWTPTEWRSGIALAERLERNASRAWILRTIAGALVENDPEQARALLENALDIARANPLPQYRAADESTVAIELARIDPDSARDVAAAIEDAAAKARALREMAGQLAEPELVGVVLADAESAAREVSDPYDRAWALRELALAEGGADAADLLDEAEEAADLVEEAEPQAFALSDIAIARATFDLDEALAILDRIGPDYPDARVAALVGIAEARISLSDSAGASSALEQALLESDEILDTYERERAVNTIVADMAAVDHEEAVTLAEEIEDPYLQGDVLRFLAVALAEEDTDAALSLADAIEPRFIRVQALIAVGAEAATDDQEAAVAIFEQALSEAGELKDTYALRLLASAWAPLDPVKALEVADRVEDDRDRVHALTDVAAAMLDTDAAKAQVTFETALETAQGIKSDDDPFAAATALQELAGTWVTVDEAEAGSLYDAAFEAAAAVAVEETG